jgi:hypothetical protein
MKIKMNFRMILFLVSQFYRKKLQSLYSKGLEDAELEIK